MAKGGGHGARVRMTEEGGREREGGRLGIGAQHRPGSALEVGILELKVEKGERQHKTARHKRPTSCQRLLCGRCS